MFIVICLFGLTLSPNRFATPNKYCLRLCLYAYLFKIITISLVYENQTITSSFTYCAHTPRNNSTKKAIKVDRIPVLYLQMLEFLLNLYHIAANDPSHLHLVNQAVPLQAF